ncbi:hypothetical protein VP01_4057g3 [Puccinia sorghi]|uniref:Retrovirus-related Pol polyprotein from transposon TNT 1-94-like beta-barrel domain-containing protein n=1 Tax=Puccinia sorghi TaxID=27349 RepID=A0A0L6URN6_9BASI|nr:hypothetical protein VP01_4057g3 [Puccinia sorghi]
MSSLLELRGVLDALESPNTTLMTNENAELKLLLILKMNSVTRNNVINAKNRNSAKNIWKAIKERFVFFKEDVVDSFITKVQVSIKKMIDVGFNLPQDILAYLVLFKFPASLQLLKRQIMHSDKDLKVEFVCNHLTQLNNKAKAKTRESGPSEAASYAGKNKNFNKNIKACIARKDNNERDSKGAGLTTMGSELSEVVFLMGTRRNTTHNPNKGYHNPKQDSNHSSKACWHLNPDKAPGWWRENQEKWKLNKDKNQVNYYMSLVTLWINHGDPKSRIILDSGASAHIVNDKQDFSQLELNNFDVIKTGKENATLPIKGMGNVTLQWKDRQIKLQNCLYVPNIVIKLIIPGCLDKKGCLVFAKNGRFKVMKSSQLVLQGSVKGGL